MALLSNPAFGPKTSLIYITAGALLDVWTGVWYFAFIRPEPGPMDNTTFFWFVGLFLTGLTLMVIGLLVGQIGQQARRAELPPGEAERLEAGIQQTAAATPHPVMPVPGMTVQPNGAMVAQQPPMTAATDLPAAMRV